MTGTPNHATQNFCVIDWEAFDLADPGDTGCVGVPVLIVFQGCIHEHIAAAKVCFACYAEFASCGSSQEWTCRECLLAGHQCPAPLRVAELAEPPDRAAVDLFLGALVDERMPCSAGGDRS